MYIYIYTHTHTQSLSLCVHIYIEGGNGGSSDHRCNHHVLMVAYDLLIAFELTGPTWVRCYGVLHKFLMQINYIHVEIPQVENDGD